MDNQNLIENGITIISVRGFKSLNNESRVEIRPLTILAGANSSGKSSIMQPLLLLKQTLDATYDPGPLLLDGPNVQFTSVDQLLSRLDGEPHDDKFTVEIEIEEFEAIISTFARQPRGGLDLVEARVELGGNFFVLTPNMAQDDMEYALEAIIEGFPIAVPVDMDLKTPEWELDVVRERCFFELGIFKLINTSDGQQKKALRVETDVSTPVEEYIRGVIHVPGLRGNPARTYKRAAHGPAFPGTFENYVASVINHWETTGDARFTKLGDALAILGLTWKVTARRVDDTQLELLVGRLSRSNNGTEDMVSIADEGFGVSQTLPVLVALLVAEPGQMVYLEQPEIHLHPRAQTALAEVIADAAKRGVRVVLETHSSLLLLGVQTLVAEGKLAPELVKLHWFERDPESGITKITSADLDRAGTFGDWPEDFATVDLDAQSRYLDAAELEHITTYSSLDNEGVPSTGSEVVPAR